MQDAKAAQACLPGCRCKEHFGLAEYMRQLTGNDYGLPSAPLAGKHHTLRVQTLGPEPEDAIALPIPVACDGTLTCGCDPCVADRMERVRRGGIGAGPAQLVPRAPRRLRQAA